MVLSPTPPHHPATFTSATSSHLNIFPKEKLQDTRGLRTSFSTSDYSWPVNIRFFLCQDQPCAQAAFIHGHLPSL